MKKGVMKKWKEISLKNKKLKEKIKRFGVGICHCPCICDILNGGKTCGLCKRGIHDREYRK